MLRRVLKWEVQVDDNYHSVGFGNVVLVDVQYSNSPDVVMIWTEETEETLKQFRLARVYGTGHAVPDDEQHLGSTVAAEGALVWHVFASPL